MIEYFMPSPDLEDSELLPWWSADKIILMSSVGGTLQNGKTYRSYIYGRELRYATMLEF